MKRIVFTANWKTYQNSNILIVTKGGYEYEYEVSDGVKAIIGEIGDANATYIVFKDQDSKNPEWVAIYDATNARIFPVYCEKGVYRLDLDKYQEVEKEIQKIIFSELLRNGSVEF